MEFLLMDRNQALFQQTWCLYGSSLVPVLPASQSDKQQLQSSQWAKSDSELNTPHTALEQQQTDRGGVQLAMPTESDKDRQVLFRGLLFTMRNFLDKVDEKPTDSKPLVSSPTFRSYETPTYKLHYLETLSGYRFVLITEPQFPSLQSVLEHTWKSLFIPLVVFAPGFTAHLPSAPQYSDIEKAQRQLFILESTDFADGLTKYLNSLPWLAKLFVSANNPETNA